MKIFALIIPLIFIASFLFAFLKKVRVYESFSEGVKGAVPLVLSIFPYLVSIILLTKLLDASGLSARIISFLRPVFSLFGVPEELAPLILIKPMSGSGALAVLSDILGDFGVDSFIGRCACVVYGSSETIFYIGAVYFAGIPRKTFSSAVAIALFSYLLSIVFACFLCRVM
jgi:spore maturation protein B